MNFLFPVTEAKALEYSRDSDIFLIRVLRDQLGGPMFVAEDVAIAMKWKNPKEAVKMLLAPLKMKRIEEKLGVEAGCLFQDDMEGAHIIGITDACLLAKRLGPESTHFHTWIEKLLPLMDELKSIEMPFKLALASAN